jgi:hypothetical protein
MSINSLKFTGNAQGYSSYNQNPKAQLRKNEFAEELKNMIVNEKRADDIFRFIEDAEKDKDIGDILEMRSIIRNSNLSEKNQLLVLCYLINSFDPKKVIFEEDNELFAFALKFGCSSNEKDLDKSACRDIADMLFDLKKEKPSEQDSLFKETFTNHLEDSPELRAWAANHCVPMP